MELKHLSGDFERENAELLIVPYGIETRKGSQKNPSEIVF